MLNLKVIINLLFLRFSSLRFVDTSSFQIKKKQKVSSVKRVYQAAEAAIAEEEHESASKEGSPSHRADTKSQSTCSGIRGSKLKATLEKEYIELPLSPMELEELVRSQCMETRQILLQRLDLVILSS